MAKYRVNLGSYANFTTTVEADNEDAALEAAYEETPGLCFQCAGWGRGWSLELGDDWGETDIELIEEEVEEAKS